jgi:hypothetical protein
MDDHGRGIRVRNGERCRGCNRVAWWHEVWSLDDNFICTQTLLIYISLRLVTISVSPYVRDVTP